MSDLSRFVVEGRYGPADGQRTQPDVGATHAHMQLMGVGAICHYWSEPYDGGLFEHAGVSLKFSPGNCTPPDFKCCIHKPRG